MTTLSRHLTAVAGLTAALALLAAGCASGGPGGTGSSGGSSAPSSNGSTVTVGLIEHETGPSAFYGLTEIKGMKAAAKVINASGGILGKKITFDIQDDADTPAKSVQAVKQLAANSAIPVILGPTNAPSDLADAPVASQQHIPEIFNTGGVASLSGNYGYTVLMPFPYMATYTLDKFFGATKDKTAAVVTQSNNEAFTSIQPTIRSTLKRLGVKLVADESYQQGSVDFSSIIAPIKSKQPQAVILNMIDVDAARFVSQARQAGITGQWVGSTNSELTSALQKAPGNSANQMVVSGVYDDTHPSALLRPYLSVTKQLYGGSLQSVAVYGYDSVLLLKKAVEQAGAWNRQKINNALQHISTFNGAAGTYKKNKGNQFWETQPPMEILKNGQFGPYQG